MLLFLWVFLFFLPLAVFWACIAVSFYLHETSRTPLLVMVIIWGLAFLIFLISKGGLFFIVLFTFILILYLWSLLLNIKQGLFVKACNIMIDNPGKSINRRALVMLITIIILTLSLLLFLQGNIILQKLNEIL